MNTTHSADTEADALNAPSITPVQIIARNLAEQWEAKESELRLQCDQAGGTACGHILIRLAKIADCRRELQAAFGLDHLGAQAGEPERKP